MLSEALMSFETEAEAMKYHNPLLAVGGLLMAVPALAQPAATDIADQVRLQGYPCDGPVKAQQDTKQIEAR